MSIWHRLRGMRVPLWIWIYGAVTIAGSAIGIIAGLGRFELFYGQAIAGLDVTHPVVAHLGGLWASKNIAYIAAFATGFAMRAPQVLAAIFAMKFVNDSIDMFVFGPLHLGQPLGQIIPGWLILGLPSALAAIHLFIRMRQQA